MLTKRGTPGRVSACHCGGCGTRRFFYKSEQPDVAGWTCDDCRALTSVDVAMERGKCPECAASEDACACGFFKRNRERDGRREQVAVYRGGEEQ